MKKTLNIIIICLVLAGCYSTYEKNKEKEYERMYQKFIYQKFIKTGIMKWESVDKEFLERFTNDHVFHDFIIHRIQREANARIRLRFYLIFHFCLHKAPTPSELKNMLTDRSPTIKSTALLYISRYYKNIPKKLERIINYMAETDPNIYIRKHIKKYILKMQKDKRNQCSGQ